MEREEEKLPPTHLAQKALLTSSEWTIVAPTMSGLHVEAREMLKGPVVAVERALMLARRMRIQYWATTKSLRHRMSLPPGMIGVWAPDGVKAGYLSQGLPWEELTTGMYVGPDGVPMAGDALTLSLEECFRRGAKRIRLLGIDATITASLRGTLRAMVMEGRKQGLDIQIPEAQTLIAVRKGRH